MRNLQIIKRPLKNGEFSYTARVRVTGHKDQIKTFTNEKEAQEWATLIKSDMLRGTFQDLTPLRQLTLTDVLDYWEPTAKLKKSYSGDLRFRLKKWRKNKELLGRPVGNLKVSDFADFVTQRQKSKVSDATIKNDLAVILSAWRFHPETARLDCPAKFVVRNLKSARKRDRRISDDEQKYLLAALENTNCSDEKRANKWVFLVVRFAIETAARLSEIVNMNWPDVSLDDATAFFRETKNGQPRFCPLSREALAVLQDARILGGGATGQVFKTTANAVKLSWNRARARARDQYKNDGGKDENFLIDFRFHDLRHEAASRWAVHIDNVLDLQQVTGHKDLRSLQRYVNKNREDAIRIAKKMSDAQQKMKKN
jgi:integrase